MRYILNDFGYKLIQNRFSHPTRPIIQIISRYRNGFMITGYKPDATTAARWRFPDGLPILTERQARVKDGMMTYHLARSFQEECRIFVDQEYYCLISCKEQQHPTGTERRLLITGLDKAVVTIYPPKEYLSEDGVSLTIGKDKVGYKIDYQRACIYTERISGALMVTW